MHPSRRLRLITFTTAAAFVLSGCASVYDPSAAAPPRWVRAPETTSTATTLVGQERAEAAWDYAVDFAFTHQFREELMDPQAPPTSQQLLAPMEGRMSPRAEVYWREQLSRADHGDHHARANLDALQFSGWSPDATITRPASRTMLLTQAIEDGVVDYDTDVAAIKVTFSYTATLRMSERGHLIGFNASNPVVYWLKPTPAGSFVIDGYEGELEISQG